MRQFWKMLVTSSDAFTLMMAHFTWKCTFCRQDFFLEPCVFVVTAFTSLMLFYRKDGVPIGYKGCTFHRYTMWKLGIFSLGQENIAWWQLRLCVDTFCCHIWSSDDCYSERLTKYQNTCIYTCTIMYTLSCQNVDPWFHKSEVPLQIWMWWKWFY